MTRNTATPPVTIKDIALRIGMAHTTVSRALNDHPRISADTKDKVRLAAQELGYVANSGARSMRSGTAKVVGLIVPDIQNEFYNAAARAMAEQCAASGYQLILGISEDDPSREEQHIRTLRESRVAGVLITPTSAPTDLSVRLLDGVPTVQLLRFDRRLGSQVVRANDQQALRDCTDHLIRLGHRRIGLVSPPVDVSTGRQRFNGYRAAMKAAGVEIDQELLAFGPARPEFGEAAFERLHALDQPPSALVVSSSRLVLGVLRAAHRLGVSVPGQLSLVVYGDADWFSVCEPQITASALPIHEMSQTATRLLFASLAPAQGARARQGRGRVVTTQFMVRGSTAACRPKARPDHAIPGFKSRRH